MIKEIRTIVDLSEDQSQQIARNSGGYRFIYNAYVDKARRDLKENTQTVNREEIDKFLEETALEEGKEWLKDFSELEKEKAYKDAETDIELYREENETAEKKKYPRYKAKSDNEGLEISREMYGDKIEIKENSIVLGEFGEVEVEKEFLEELDEGYETLVVVKEKNFFNRPTGKYILKAIRK